MSDFDTSEMRYKVRYHVVHASTDWRCLIASQWQPEFYGPPHPSWCPELWARGESRV